MKNNINNEPILLLIETATEMCSVAISKGEQIIAKREDASGYAHAEKLFLYIDEAVQQAQLTPAQLHGVVVSAGPGSYTGLRIGASAAKGLAFGLEIPLLSVSTLESIFYAAQKQHPSTNALFIPMLDARRMEVYTATYQHDGTLVKEASATIINEEYVAQLPTDTTIIVSGNGASKTKELITLPNVIFDATPLSAESLLTPALLKFNAEQYEDAAYFEPYYLKEYVAVKSQVKGLYK